MPRTRLLFGERAFQVTAPKMWNQLPHDVRSIDNTNTFKKKLKTFLFTKFYDMDFICHYWSAFSCIVIECP